MNIDIDYRVDKVIHSLSQKDNARIIKVLELFNNYGFRLPSLYLKKLNKDVWELRTGKYGLLFGLVENRMIIVNLFYKQSQKTPRKEIRLSIDRLRKYYEK